MCKVWGMKVVECEVCIFAFSVITGEPHKRWLSQLIHIHTGTPAHVWTMHVCILKLHHYDFYQLFDVPINIYMPIQSDLLMSQTWTQSSLSWRTSWHTGVLFFDEFASFFSLTLCWNCLWPTDYCTKFVVPKVWSHVASPPIGELRIFGNNEIVLHLQLLAIS